MLIQYVCNLQNDMASFPSRQTFINVTWRTSQLIDSYIDNLWLYALSIDKKRNELKMERYIYRSVYFLSEGTERIYIILVLATNNTCVDLIMVRDGPVRLKPKPNLLRPIHT
jgi:hypothetical protein